MRRNRLDPRSPPRRRALALFAVAALWSTAARLPSAALAQEHPGAIDEASASTEEIPASFEEGTAPAIAPTIFDDSFESGDVCAWDSPSPAFPLLNCDGVPGCEVDLSSVTGACGDATNVGTYDGDRSCGFICPINTAFDQFALRTGRASVWFKARVFEDSDCSTSIEHRVRLVPPAGHDYDLYVWRNCLTPAASSTSNGSAAEEVVISQGDGTSSNDSFDYWVEVRYVSGLSCSTWELTFAGHNCP